MTHFLDKTVNILKEMPEEARQLASFLALLVDAHTKRHTAESDKLRCFIEKCTGTIISEFSSDRKEILWECSACSNQGRISFWQGTKWDNSDD